VVVTLQGKTDIDDVATSTAVGIETRRGDDVMIPLGRLASKSDHLGPGVDEVSQSLPAGEDVPAPQREGTTDDEGAAV